MAKWSGNIGFAIVSEDAATHIYSTTNTEQTYYGELIQNRYRHDEGNTVNGNVSLNMSVSLIGDLYFQTNWPYAKYITGIGGTTNKWTISSVEFKGPRAILSLGGVYNG